MLESPPPPQRKTKSGKGTQFLQKGSPDAGIAERVKYLGILRKIEVEKILKNLFLIPFYLKVRKTFFGPFIFRKTYIFSAIFPGAPKGKGPKLLR
jgi:hypothetical protein